MNKLMERAAELMKSVDEFGPTHIITADGNLEDSNITFVEQEMKKCTPPPTDDERELVTLLKAMTLDARYTLWESIYGDY